MTQEIDNLRKQISSLEKLVQSLTVRLEKIEKKKSKVKHEQYYQIILENLTGCGHEYIAECGGHTDITTERCHIEIKKWA